MIDATKQTGCSTPKATARLVRSARSISAAMSARSRTVRCCTSSPLVLHSRYEPAHTSSASTVHHTVRSAM